MLISTKGRYALRVMIDLARHEGEGYIPLKEIAQRQGISEKYLEAILKLLVANHLVEGLRGKNGGYTLSRSPAECTAWDVISVTETDFVAVSCLSPEAAACDRAAECATLPMWRAFNAEIRRFFSRYTIRSLAEGELPEEE